MIKTEINMNTVIEALILLRHLKKMSDMFFTATRDSHLPKGYRITDFDRVLKELEEVKITAKELYPQLRVE